MASEDDREEDRSRRRRGDDYDDYDDYDRPRRRRQAPPGIEPTEFLIPTGVSAWSMAACYFGIFSCVIPVLGLIMALIALPCGIVALRRRKKATTYGAVTGDVRAIIGIVSSSLTIVGYLIIVIAIASKP